MTSGPKLIFLLMVLMKSVPVYEDYNSLKKKNNVQFANL